MVDLSASMADDINKYNINPILFDLQDKLLQVKALLEFGNNEQAQKIMGYSLQSIEYATFAIQARQTSLPLTSFSASAVVSQSVYELSNLAKTHGFKLNFESSKSLDLVFSNPIALKGLMHGLISSLITDNLTDNKNKVISIAVQQTKDNYQRIGVYGYDLSIKPSQFTKSIQLAETSRMSAPEITSGSGLGLTTSYNLVEALGFQLKSFQHKGLSGVGIYVPISKQLTLV